MVDVGEKLVVVAGLLVRVTSTTKWVSFYIASSACSGVSASASSHTMVSSPCAVRLGLRPLSTVSPVPAAHSHARLHVDVGLHAAASDFERSDCEFSIVVDVLSSSPVEVSEEVRIVDVLEISLGSQRCCLLDSRDLRSVLGLSALAAKRLPDSACQGLVCLGLVLFQEPASVSLWVSSLVIFCGLRAGQQAMGSCALGPIPSHLACVRPFPIVAASGSAGHNVASPPGRSVQCCVVVLALGVVPIPRFHL